MRRLEQPTSSTDHTEGGHAFYKAKRNGVPYKVTVSTHIREFSIDLLQSMCRQAGLNRKEFYGACESAARKIR